MLFWPSTHYGFVDVDDPDFVSANPRVLGGLSVENVEWALTSFHAANWVPSTFISLMMDSSVSGTGPVGYHRTNVVLHALNAALLFLLFWRMTGRTGASAFLALLFALHPLRVESVAWIAERKDVLSTLFWLLTTLAWVQWTRRRGRGLYALALFFFTLGLGAKGMLVTLPFTLLLLDLWPLDRPFAWRDRILEKLPFFGLSVLVSVLTVVAQRSGKAVTELGVLSPADRLATAVTGWAGYIGKLFWPVDLAYLYPHPRFVPPYTGFDTLTVASAALVLLAISALCLVLARRGRPWALTGWLWYLGTLVPVIGLLQVGMQSSADRYTYLPHIGLLWILVWGACDLIASRPALRLPLVGAGIAACAACGVLTWNAMPFWKDSASLYARALEVTDNNGMAFNGLGATLARAGRMDQAEPLLREAVRIHPRLAEAHTNLGNVLSAKGDFQGAIHEHREALRLRPGYAEACLNLGNALARTGQIKEARVQFNRAIQFDPDRWQPYYNLGQILNQLGDRAAGGRYLERALKRAPDPATRARIRSAMR